jgi:hypothetical protein
VSPTPGTAATLSPALRAPCIAADDKTSINLATRGTTAMLMNKELVTVVTLMFFHSLRKYNEGRVTKNKVEH